MNTRERFEKVRQEQRNRFSLRTRLTALVTMEMLVCVLTIEKGQIAAENIPEGGCRFTVTLRTK